MKKIYTFIVVSLFSLYISHAQIVQLWGTTYSGGSDSTGTIFKINSDESAFAVEHYCDTVTGFSPGASLFQASDGYFYGMMEQGGFDSSGVIFKYDPVAYTYTDVYDFDYFVNGGYSSNTLMEANGILYGMTSGGGQYGGGTLFNFDPAGNNFTHLYDFNDSSGIYPYGTFVQAPNGNLYGLTYEGGRYSSGTLICVNLTDSTVRVLHHFTSATGTSPEGSLMIEQNSGLLYGTTFDGGRYNLGVLFNFNIADSTYTDVYDFNDTMGANPGGSLIQFADGLLYGMSSSGLGNAYYGTIFNLNPVSKSFNNVYNFDGAKGSGPVADLLQSSGKLYGMTPFGGTYDDGVVFSFDPATTTYVDMEDFNQNNGQRPDGNLVAINSTGIPETKNVSTISLYPNPVGKELQIQSQGYSVKKIDIYNVLGEKLYSEVFGTQGLQGDTHIINVSAFSSGVYFVQLNDGQDKWIGKFVKE